MSNYYCAGPAPSSLPSHLYRKVDVAARERNKEYYRMSLKAAEEAYITFKAAESNRLLDVYKRKVFVSK